jgi:hypothetical protein
MEQDNLYVSELSAQQAALARCALVALDGAQVSRMTLEDALRGVSVE